MTAPSRIEQEAVRVLVRVMEEGAKSSAQEDDRASRTRILDEAAISPLTMRAFRRELDKLDEFSRHAVSAKLMTFFDAVIALRPGDSCEPFPGVKVRKTMPDRPQ